MTPSKPLLTSLALLLILAGGLFVWQKEPTPSLIPVVPIETPAETSVTPTDTSIDTSDWKTYRNDTLKFSVEYPGTFKIDAAPADTGHVVSFLEFDENAKNLSGQKIPNYFPVISIYQWRDINSFDLKGGSWEGEKKYTNFQDFLADSKNTSINVIEETIIDGVKAYVLSMPGEIGYEAVMFEYDGRYYRINFPWIQKPLNENVKKQFLSLIKFLK